MAHNREDVAFETSNTYLQKLDPQDLPSLEEIKDGLIEEINIAYGAENTVLPKGQKWKCITELPIYIVALVIAKTCPICRIRLFEDKTVLAMKVQGGKDNGIYRCIIDKETSRDLNGLIRRLKHHVMKPQILEVHDILLETLGVPLREVTRNPELVAVKNGVWNYNTKELIAWDDPRADEYTFLNKCPIAYNPQAQSPQIPDPDDPGYRWEFNNWLHELFSDHDNPDESVHAIWCVLHALIRNNINYRKSIWFCNPDGNGANGKSCLCDLMERLVPNVCGMRIEDFEKPFILSNLIGKSALICRETEVSGYITSAADFKSLVMQEPIMINRKYQDAINYVFHGLTVFCQNAYPRVADATGSFSRRLLILTFNQSFKGKRCRSFIQDEALKSQELLEYILFVLLREMDQREFPDFSFMDKNLKEYQLNNSPIEEFLEEFCTPEIDEDTGVPLVGSDGKVLLKLKWGLLPFEFLYDLFNAYYRKRHNNKDCNISYKNFCKAVTSWSKDSAYYEVQITGNGKAKQMRTGHLMDELEPLIHEYNLIGWKNPWYINSKDLNAANRPLLKTKYTGLTLR